ncbi:MAG: hypothetical protein JSW13_03535 [Candidatus Aerophobus sp.]|nr:MAG: hypothetical protein JSW13_03535 [Candidatus Aerophobus sp.]
MKKGRILALAILGIAILSASLTVQSARSYSEQVLAPKPFDATYPYTADFDDFIQEDCPSPPDIIDDNHTGDCPFPWPPCPPPIPPCPGEMEIDVKPGSYPNSINFKSKGRVPIAVLGSEDFDVSEIDPSTVLAGTYDDSGGASPLRWTKEDVNGDGYLDMVFFFKIQELKMYLVEDSTHIDLWGLTLGEVEFHGYDSVKITHWN